MSPQKIRFRLKFYCLSMVDMRKSAKMAIPVSPDFRDGGRSIGRLEWRQTDTGSETSPVQKRMNAESGSPSPIVVRALEPGDLDRGFLESLAALTEVDLTPAAARSIVAEMPSNSCTLVAEINGKVVGTATLLIERKFIHGGGRVGHIEDVSVHGDHQRQGVGTALVEHAIQTARQAGCYKVILDCFDDLVPFYERMGFRPFNRGLRLDLPHEMQS
jgi:glucosamine-phosphate N-acetyltransferase